MGEGQGQDPAIGGSGATGGAVEPVGGSETASIRSPESKYQAALEKMDPEDRAYFESLRGENKAKREKIRTLEERMTRLDKERSDSEAAALAEQGKYKELWEKETKRTEEVLSKSKQRIAREKVRSYAIAAGISDPGDVDFVPLDRVTVDDDLGVGGVEELIAELKSTKPHWFKKAESSEPVAPAKTAVKPTGTTVADPPASTKADPVDVRSMSKPEYEKYKKEQLAKLRTARR